MPVLPGVCQILVRQRSQGPACFGWGGRPARFKACCPAIAFGPAGWQEFAGGDQGPLRWRKDGPADVQGPVGWPSARSRSESVHSSFSIITEKPGEPQRAAEKCSPCLKLTPLDVAGAAWRATWRRSGTLFKLEHRRAAQTQPRPSPAARLDRRPDDLFVHNTAAV